MLDTLNVNQRLKCLLPRQVGDSPVPLYTALTAKDALLRGELAADKDLLKEDIRLGTMRRPPLPDMPLQRAHLSGLVGAEQLKHYGRLQSQVALYLPFHEGLIPSEEIWSGTDRTEFVQSTFVVARSW
jgi:hypothetical protein